MAFSYFYNMYKVKTLLLCLVFGLLWHSSQAQHYNFRTYSVDDGLAQSQVLSMIQDSRGYLWLGTYGGGISKFDGISFQNFSKKDGLSDNIVSAVYEDKDGNIWMGMGNNDGGACVYNGKTFKTLTTRDGLSNNKVFCIVQDNKGNMWFGTDDGLNRFDGKKIETFNTIKSKILHNRIRSAYKDRDGNLWFATDAGVIKYNGEKFVNIPITSKGNLSIIWSIKQDHLGNMWFALFQGGVAKFDGDQITLYTEKDGLVSDVIYSICEDINGNMWFGSDSKGVSKFDGKNFTTFSTSQGLVNNRIREIIRDKEDNLWFATDGGICRYNGTKFSSYSKAEGLPNEIVNATFIDSKNNTWFGTEEGLCVLSADKNLKIYTTTDGLPHNRIWNITEDSQKNIWIGTYGGLSIFDGKTFTSYTNKDGLHNDIIYVVFIDSNNNMWVGTDAGVYFYNGTNIWTKNKKIAKDFKFYFKELGPTGFRIRSIHEDSRHNLWFGTREGGVLKYDGKKFTNYSVKEGLGNNTVLSIIEDENHSMWFATYGGGISKLVEREKRISFTSLNSTKGLSDDDASSLLIDDSGNMWVGTIKGLSKFDLKTYNKTGEIIFRNFGREEGFTGVECSQNAGFKDNLGNLWEGTVKGVFKIDPSLDVIDSVPPITLITKLNLFFKDINWEEFNVPKNRYSFLLPDNIIFPYDQNHITFYFKGLNFSSPEKVLYQFKLEGLDKDWSPSSKETYATYSQIPSGKYTFMVKSCNGDGIWNIEPTTYQFSIETPFWKKGWFFAIIFILLISLLYSYVRWRERSLQLEKKILEEKIEFRTFELRKEKEKVDSAHKDIKDSINYAQRIQQSILPKDEFIYQLFNESFVFYKPKDTVSGDFYWASIKNGKKIIAAVDCTGHGVPGAFMSMLGNSLLNEIINERGIVNPSEILDQLRKGVLKNFQHSETENETKDGMDISLCVFDDMKVEFSGANNSLYVIRQTDEGKNEIIEIKGDRQPIGAFAGLEDEFTSKVFSLEKGDHLYFFTDGYTDQFGGPNNKKYKIVRLQELLLSIQCLPVADQKKRIIHSLSDWQGNNAQVDDILVICIKI